MTSKLFGRLKNTSPGSVLGNGDEGCCSWCLATWAGDGKGDEEGQGQRGFAFFQRRWNGGFGKESYGGVEIEKCKLYTSFGGIGGVGCIGGGGRGV